MTKKISCKELKVEGCHHTAQAASSGAALEEMVEHLRKEHDIDLPEAEEILEGDFDPQAWDESTNLLITRMREELNLPPLDPAPETAEEAEPATSAAGKPPRDA